MGSPYRTVNVMSDRHHTAKPSIAALKKHNPRKTAKQTALKAWLNTMHEANVEPDGTLSFTPRSWYDLYQADILNKNEKPMAYTSFLNSIATYFDVLTKRRVGCNVRMGNGVMVHTTTLSLKVRKKPNHFLGD